VSLSTLMVQMDSGNLTASGGFILDDSTFGKLDTAFLGAGEPSWDFDITPYVRGLSTHRGTSNELQRVEAGTGSILLDNRDGRFTPTNTLSPYYPNIVPMRRFRILATWNAVTYPVFSGYAESWPVTFPQVVDQVVEVQLVDGFTILARAAVSGSFSAQTSGQRVTAILDAIEWPNGSQGTIAFANLGASANPDFSSSTSQSSYVNTSWTPPTSELIVVFVSSNALASPNAPTVSGNGLTWVQIATVVNGTTMDRLTLFAANALGSTTGATTFDFGGQTQQVFSAMFMQVTGADLSGSVAAAFAQTVSANATATSGSITLAAAGNSNNRPISGWFLDVNLAMAPRTNWAEMDELIRVGRYETQYRPDAFETTATVTWDGTSHPYLGIAAELKVGTPSSSNRDIETGASSVPAVTLENVSALQHLQEIEHAEGGRLFMSRDGKVTFRDRYPTIIDDFSTRTWSDDGTDMTYRDITLTFNDETLFNDIRLTRTGGTEQTATSLPSIQKYFRRSLVESDIQLATDAEVLSLANALLSRYSETHLGIVGLVDNAMKHGFWDRVLTREIQDFALAEKTPSGSDSIQQTSVIEGITHEVTPDTWTVTLTVSPSEGAQVWVLDDADLSILDDTTVLAR
jgi:hypothetical protein